MSKDWTYYDVVCQDCGSTGELGIWVDDWNRWGSSWTGFDGSVYITGAPRSTTTCLKCKGKKVSIAIRTHPGSESQPEKG